MSRGPVVAASCGALLAAALCYLPQRPPVARITQVTVPSVAAMAGDLATVSAAGRGVVLGARDNPACRALALPVARARSGDVSTLNLGLRRVDRARPCDPWWARVVQGLRRADVQPPGVAPGAPPPPLTSLDRLGLALSVLLIGALAGVGLWWLWSLPVRRRRWLLVVFALAAGVRLAVPDRLSMVYFGYELMARAWYLDALPRYGPAGAALWSMVLGPLSAEPASILRLHDLLGALTVSLFAEAAARVAGRRGAGVAVAIALGLTPLFVRDHGSESLHVGAMAALAAACLAVSSRRPLRGGQLLVASGAVALAGLFRGDVALLALPTVLVWRRLAGGGFRVDAGVARRDLWLAAALLVGSLALAAALGLARAAADLARDNLPQLPGLAAALPRLLLTRDALLRPALVPVAFWAAVALYIALPRRGGGAPPWLALPGLAVLWLLPYYADFNETSMTRLQVPAATWLAVGAAAMAADLSGRARRPVPVAIGFGLAFVISAALTVPALSARTNAHDEDALLSEVARLLPADRPFWLVTRTYAEGPAVDLHLHLPTWLFQPPVRPGRVVSATDYLRAAGEGRLPPNDVFFLESYRCWMRRGGRGAPSRLHPACAAIRRAHVRRPILRRAVPNRGDSPTFDLYGASAELEVGLYQLVDGRQAGGQRAGGRLGGGAGGRGPPPDSAPWPPRAPRRVGAAEACPPAGLWPARSNRARRAPRVRRGRAGGFGVDTFLVRPPTPCTIAVSPRPLGPTPAAPQGPYWRRRWASTPVHSARSSPWP